jgi:signal transduction histidine kinase
MPWSRVLICPVCPDLRRALSCALPAKATIAPFVKRLFAILIVLCIGFEAAAANGQRRRIYILEALSPAVAAHVRTIDGFRRRLQERTAEEFEIFVDYMELLRLPSQAHLDSTVNYLSQKYAEAPPDILITLGRGAIPVILNNQNVIAPNVPTIIANVPSTAVLSADQLRNAVYVVSQYDFAKTLELAQQLQPDARNLAIIGGASDYDRQWLNDAHRQLQPHTAHYTTKDISQLAYEDMLREVSQLPKDTIVILSVFLADSSGNARTTTEVAADIARVSPAPVYSPVAGTIGMGVFGGYADDWEAHGATVADVAFEILSGKSVVEIPRLNASQHMNRIDERQLTRWNIRKSAIPADAELSFPEFNLWEQYRWYVIGAASFIVFQSLLIAALFLQRDRGHRAETDIRNKESALRVSYEQVRQLAGQLINAQEKERARIARELHDDVGQRVASLSIGLSSLKRRVAGSDETMRSELSRLQQQTMGVAEDLRDLSHELHQGAIEHLGLPEALRARCEELNGEAGTRIEFEVAEDWTEVANDIKLCLYRVAQEALRNIAKHAHARMGRVAIAHRDGQVVMRISDDGLGFATQGPNGHQGIGLLSMRERVRMLGGNFEVKSAPNGGTVATVTIPTGGRC